MSDKRYKRIVCKDGYNISIQAHYGAYCLPRISEAKLGYSQVELGFPSESDSLINEYAECHSADMTEENYTGNVYPYVPVAAVALLLEKHGGIVEGEHPPFNNRKERRWVKVTDKTIEFLTLSSIEDTYEEKWQSMPRRMKRFTNFEDYIVAKTYGYSEIEENNFIHLSNLIKTLVAP